MMDFFGILTVDRCLGMFVCFFPIMNFLDLVSSPRVVNSQVIYFICMMSIIKSSQALTLEISHFLPRTSFIRPHIPI